MEQKFTEKFSVVSVFQFSWSFRDWQVMMEDDEFTGAICSLKTKQNIDMLF